MSKKHILVLIAILAVWLVPATGTGPSFSPDFSFKGSSLTGWHVVGAADWRAQDGEIIGTVKPGGSGGWLALDRSYQDVAFYASFRCTGGCRTGIMLRGEKTATGGKGVFVSLTDGDLASYSMTVDGQGKEVHREPLRYAGGQVRNAPPPDPAAAGRGAAASQ